MSKYYRVIFQAYDDCSPDIVVKEELIIGLKITIPTNRLDFTMGIEAQLSMIGRIQDNVLNEKLALLAGMQDRHRPIADCTGNLVKCGKQKLRSINSR